MEPHDFDPPGPLSEGDAIDHLWNAAHETLRAMRLLIDAADEFVEAQRAERPAARGGDAAREGRVHHIDIDLGTEWNTARTTDTDADADVAFGSGAGAS
jgi:hypothetical protein